MHYECILFSEENEDEEKKRRKVGVKIDFTFTRRIWRICWAHSQFELYIFNSTHFPRRNPLMVFVSNTQRAFYN